MTNLNWTDWHLTPAGWVAGTNSIDGVSQHVLPPCERVLSYRFRVALDFTLGRVEMLYRSEDESMIRKLSARYGECPRKVSHARARTIRPSRTGAP